MHILQIASEFTPLAKVGGLADVVYGLSRNLLGKGHKVGIILPKYGFIDTHQIRHLKKHPIAIFHQEGNLLVESHLFQGKFEDLDLYLIEIPHPQGYFERDEVYGYPDDPDRFTSFTKACKNWLKEKPFKSVDILHLHDWPTAFLAALLKQEENPLSCVLTLHNIQHQGKAPESLLERRGFSLPIPAPFIDPCNPRLVNLLRSGIEMCDALTTVSPTYRREILTPQGGCGLQEVLKRHEKKFTGILNGIDWDYYNPVKDPKLFYKYPPQIQVHPELVSEAKEKNKKELFEKMGKPYAPYLWTLSAITRLVEQKSPHLIIYALEKAVKMNAGFILVGSLHGSDYQALFDRVIHTYQNHPRVILCINKDDILAHQAYAASDAILIPSLFEPCGLTQMIGMRYGSVPLARLTGGLADTVFDIDTRQDIDPKKRNGFTFDIPDEKGIDWVVDRAFNIYQNNKPYWNQIVAADLSYNLSWEKPAHQYEAIYQSLSERLK